VAAARFRQAAGMLDMAAIRDIAQEVAHKNFGAKRVEDAV
jgi:hypothetical protein